MTAALGLTASQISQVVMLLSACCSILFVPTVLVSFCAASICACADACENFYVDRWSFEH